MIFEKICCALIFFFTVVVSYGVSIDIVGAHEAGMSAALIVVATCFLLLVFHLKRMVKREDDAKALDKMVSEDETERLNIRSDIEWHG